MYWAQDRVGPVRATDSYAWKTFEDQGTVLAFGTDYPVEPVTPFRGLYAAVTRKSEDGKRYHPEQALTIEQALYNYTEAPAFAERTETRKGRLSLGAPNSRITSPEKIPLARTRGSVDRLNDEFRQDAIDVHSGFLRVKQ
jgi:predicted amidohydrolase YtcJ